MRQLERITDDSVAQVVRKCILLAQYHCISKVLGYMVSNGLMSVNEGKALPERINSLCADLAKVSLSICDAFDVPEKILTPCIPVCISFISSI